MTKLQLQLLPRSPLAEYLRVEAEGRGITFSDRSGLAMATVLERKGQGAALTARVREHFSIELPKRPQRAASSSLVFAGTGVGTWLATSEHSGEALSALLREKLGDSASVVDQSDGYAVLRMSGPAVRQLLAKLVPVDVHPRAFQIDDVAATVASHVGVTLWRLNDRSDGSAVFEMAAARSLTGSLWHAVSTGAAEFGYCVESPNLAGRSLE